MSKNKNKNKNKSDKKKREAALASRAIRKNHAKNSYTAISAESTFPFKASLASNPNGGSRSYNSIDGSDHLVYNAENGLFIAEKMAKKMGISDASAVIIYEDSPIKPLNGDEMMNSIDSNNSELLGVDSHHSDHVEMVEEDRKQVNYYPTGLYRIPIHGMIVSNLSYDEYSFEGEYVTPDDIINRISYANMDPYVDEIVLDFNTPGGELFLGQEVVQTIRNSKKPIHGYISGYACSQGFLFASATRSITGAKDSIVGSLGVMTHYIPSDMMNGVSISQFGQLKNSEESSIVIGNELEELYHSTIAEGRNTTLDRVRSEFGQGAEVIASRAESLGMIDSIQSRQDYYMSMIDRIAFDESKIEHIEYRDLEVGDKVINANSNMSDMMVAENVKVMVPVTSAYLVKKATAINSKNKNLNEKTGEKDKNSSNIEKNHNKSDVNHDIDRTKMVLGTQSHELSRKSASLAGSEQAEKVTLKKAAASANESGKTIMKKQSGDASAEQVVEKVEDSISVDETQVGNEIDSVEDLANEETAHDENEKQLALDEANLKIEETEKELLEAKNALAEASKKQEDNDNNKEKTGDSKITTESEELKSLLAEAMQEGMRLGEEKAEQRAKAAAEEKARAEKAASDRIEAVLTSEVGKANPVLAQSFVNNEALADKTAEQVISLIQDLVPVVEEKVEQASETVETEVASAATETQKNLEAKLEELERKLNSAKEESASAQAALAEERAETVVSPMVAAMANKENSPNVSSAIGSDDPLSGARAETLSGEADEIARRDAAFLSILENLTPSARKGETIEDKKRLVEKTNELESVYGHAQEKPIAGATLAQFGLTSRTSISRL